VLARNENLFEPTALANLIVVRAIVETVTLFSNTKPAIAVYVQPEGKRVLQRGYG
jgi:hypothetical protein